MGAKLPSAMGSAAALVTAFLSFIAQVSPVTCAVRSVMAFAIFAAFGIVLRYLLASAEVNAALRKAQDQQSDGLPLAIAPGTSVQDALNAGGAAQADLGSQPAPLKEEIGAGT